jgi:hypothetical protein
MEDTERVDRAPRWGVMGILRLLALVVLIRALGDRAWWLVPPVVFTGFIIAALFDGRGRPTAKDVLIFAATAIAIGVVLKLFE